MGFLGFIGKAIGVATSIIPGAGVAKTILGGVGTLVGGTGHPTITGQPLIGLGPMGGTGAFPGAGSTPTAAPRASGASGYAKGTPEVVGRVEECKLPGYHLNKNLYYRQKGAHFGGVVRVPPHTVCVKNRSMNVGNTKALRRALRRAYGFEKLAMRTIHLLHPRRGGRFGGFKKTRSRR
jgi:hypothetical protein